MPMRVKKTERLQLRLTPAEKEKLTEKAAAARMSASDYVAELIDKKKVINELCQKYGLEGMLSSAIKDNPSEVRT